MTKMSPEFQTRQKPAAALIVAVSLAAAGALVTAVRKLAGNRSRKTATAPAPAAPVTPAPARS